MRIGLFGATALDHSGIDAYVEGARQARDEGFAAWWLSHVMATDTLTTLAVVGREVDGIELGTAVVPIVAHHPLAMAQQALTTNLAAGGRLVLGIGLSHKPVVEDMWGLEFTRPVLRMREYLTVVRALINEGGIDFQGETATVRAGLQIPGAEPCPILLAALGPKMLALAGALADGTITWMTGPETLAGYTVPAIRKAAAEAGRAEPRVVAALPVCVTEDVAGARERAAARYALYGALPSYQAMLEREGAAGPADLLIAGDEAGVRGSIERLAEGGVTDFAADIFGDRGERQRTRELLQSLL